MNKDRVEIRRQDIFRKLEESMRDNPISVRQLAVETGLSVYTLHRVLKGSPFITIKTISILEKYIEDVASNKELDTYKKARNYE